MRFDYHFFFIRNESPKDFILQLPTPPESVEVTTGMNSETVNIVNLGEVNILKGKHLTEISFEGTLPRIPHSSAVVTTGEFSEPEVYIKMMEQAQKNNTPLVFTITGLGVNMKVSVDKFDYEYVTDYVNYDITLKEYKDFKAKEITLVTVEPKPSGGEQTKPKTTSVQAKQTTRTKTDFSIGDRVYCTGTYHSDSYGGGNKGVFKSGFIGKVHIIVASPQSGQVFPIHITNEAGGWYGWVKKDQLRHV